MRLRSVVFLLLAAFATWGVLRAQRFWHDEPGVEYETFQRPPDWNETTEWTRARLRYPSILAPHGYPDGYRRWTVDYPRSDRHLLQGVRRLTRINTRVGRADCGSRRPGRRLQLAHDVRGGGRAIGSSPTIWPPNCANYLLRGGFFMCDDFHGTIEWKNFTASMKKCFPDRQIVDIDNKDPIFHVIYDLDDRFQVPGWQWYYQRTDLRI